MASAGVALHATTSTALTMAHTIPFPQEKPQRRSFFALLKSQPWYLTAIIPYAHIIHGRVKGSPRESQGTILTPPSTYTHRTYFRLTEW